MNEKRIDRVFQLAAAMFSNPSLTDVLTEHAKMLRRGQGRDLYELHTDVINDVADMAVEAVDFVEATFNEAVAIEQEKRTADKLGKML